MPESFLNYRVYGPYISKEDGRSRVVLYDENKRKQTMSYPKYLWWKHKGMLIANDEHIHHKDEDFTNNSIDNFEVINIHLHMSKHTNPNAISRTEREFKCPSCHITFIKNIRNIKGNQVSKNKAGPFCSKSCAGRYGQQFQINFRKPGITNKQPKRSKYYRLARKLYKLRHIT